MSEQILKDLSFFTPEIVLTVTLLAAIIADLVTKRSAQVIAARGHGGIPCCRRACPGTKRYACVDLLQHAGRGSVRVLLQARDPALGHPDRRLLARLCRIEYAGQETWRVLCAACGPDAGDGPDGRCQQSADDVPGPRALFHQLVHPYRATRGRRPTPAKPR